MTGSLSIAIASSGRFHVLDLARELHAMGHRVRFYSYVPKARAMAFGLPAECHVGLLPALAPLLAWQRFAPDLAPARREAATYRALDWAVSRTLQRCDVFIAMSGMYLDACRHARTRFGARLVLVRGSKHILAQDEILARVPGAVRPTALTVQRELTGYELADMIDVPSAHAVASFARSPHLTKKLVANPYGVDLDMFPQRQPVIVEADEDIEFLFVGTWSLIKGCDLLLEAVARVPGIRLRHVGPVGDAPRASAESAIAHVGPVDQSHLRLHYAGAHCLVLPSREDGFGMVLNQALASGLALLASYETGAPDLKARPGLAERIELIPAGDLGALVAGLAQMRDRLRGIGPPPSLDHATRAELGWDAYARRYERNLGALVQQASKPESPSGEVCVH